MNFNSFRPPSSTPTTNSLQANRKHEKKGVSSQIADSLSSNDDKSQPQTSTGSRPLTAQAIHSSAAIDAPIINKDSIAILSKLNTCSLIVKRKTGLIIQSTWPLPKPYTFILSFDPKTLPQQKSCYLHEIAYWIERSKRRFYIAQGPRCKFPRLRYATPLLKKTPSTQR